MTSVDSLQWDRLACDLRLARSAAADTPEAERLKILREMLAGALKGLDDQRRKACLEQLRRSFPAFGVYEMQPVASPQPAQEPQRLTLPELLHELGKVVAKTERREAVRLARSALEVMPKQEQEEVLGFLRALLPTEKAPAVPTPPPAPAPAPPPLPENGTKDWGELVGKKFALGRSAQLDDLERIVEAFRDSRRTLKEINKYAADTMHSLTRKVVSQGMGHQQDYDHWLPKNEKDDVEKVFLATAKGTKPGAYSAWLIECLRRCLHLFNGLAAGPHDVAETWHSAFEPTKVRGKTKVGTFKVKEAAYWLQYSAEFFRLFGDHESDENEQMVEVQRIEAAVARQFIVVTPVTEAVQDLSIEDSLRSVL